MKLIKGKKNEDNTNYFFNGSFKEVELLGEGSYGKVYKAKKEEFGVITYSAIKQIEIPKTKAEINTLKSEGMTQRDITQYFEQTVQKWVEEINLMSLFKDSENIVNIEDYEIIPKGKDIGFIINIRMELLNNLDSYIYEKNITDKEILKMAIDVSTALEDCEKENVVHRDIKPDNIFVNSKGVYKVGDFGIAKHIDSTVSNMSKKGTENYMAPELYKNEKGNKTVDIYSLGIMLYRYFNYNRLPFLPNYPEKITPEAREDALYKRIIGEKMKPPMNATRDIAEIILKACNYYPKDRYQSATELKQALENVYDELKESKILFDYNENKMSKLYTKNSLSDTHDKTLSILTGSETKETESNNIELQSLNDKECDNSNDIVVEENIGTQDINIENKIIETEKKIDDKEIEPEINNEENVDIIFDDNKIKSKANIKLKNKKIIILVILILFILSVSLYIFLKPSEIKYIVVPNVIKMESSKGTELLTDEGFVIEYEYVEVDNEEEIGIILEQSLKENTKAEKGTLIVLKVSVSKEKVELINTVGMSIEEASEKLKEIGLNVITSEQYSDTISKGFIISQMPEANNEVNRGSTIELLVSKGEKEKEAQEDEDKKDEQQKNEETKSEKTDNSWSDWVTSLPSNVTSNSFDIESKKQYRSQSKETTTSTEANLSGWKLYDTKTEYEYGSSKQVNDICVSCYKDETKYLLENSTRDGYHVIGKYCANYNQHNIFGSYLFSLPIVGVGQEVTAVCSTSSYELQEAAVLSSEKPSIGDTIKVTDWYSGKTVSASVFEVFDNYLITYKPVTNVKKVYYYEKWSNWSSWQDSSINSGSSVKVETRTVYRYKKK